jgi:glycine cleavage system H lipoate-binding protein
MIHFRDSQILAAVEAGGELVHRAKRLAVESREKLRTSSTGYRLAEGYYYHCGHTWAQPLQGGRIRIGLDDFVGKVLGPPDRLRLPRRGETLRQDQQGWSLTREGRQARFLAPLTGKVFAVNDQAMEDPAGALKDPYSDGWLLVLEPLVPQPELNRLYRGEQSARWLEEENHKLLELLGPEYERLAATGGEPIEDLFGHYPEIGWEKLVSTFLKNTARRPG